MEPKSPIPPASLLPFLACPTGALEASGSRPGLNQSVWKISSTWCAGMEPMASLQLRNEPTVNSGGQSRRGQESAVTPESVKALRSLPEQLLLTLNSMLISGYVDLSSEMGLEIGEIRIETSGQIAIESLLKWYQTEGTAMGSIHYLTSMRSNGPSSQLSDIHNKVKTACRERLFRPGTVTMYSQLIIR
jgi:hypothetical protein